MINSSYNPHISYKFNYHLANKREMKNFLINLNNKKKRRIIPKMFKNQTYEFFYVHKFVIAKDDFFLIHLKNFINIQITIYILLKGIVFCKETQIYCIKLFKKY